MIESDGTKIKTEYTVYAHPLFYFCLKSLGLERALRCELKSNSNSNRGLGDGGPICIGSKNLIKKVFQINLLFKIKFEMIFHR